MFGIGFTETLLILAVVLIVFGPEKLPELSKTLGHFFGKAKHESDKIKREFYNTMHPPADFRHLDNNFEDEQHSNCENISDENEFKKVPKENNNDE